MKAKLLPLLLALLLCLCACEGGEGSLRGEPAVPLDRIAQAVQSGNAGLYETAFPPDFIQGYGETYGDLDGTLGELLTTARDKNQSDCGETWTLRYELQSKEVISVDELGASCVLNRFNDYVYALPVEQITQAAAITVIAYVEGGMGEQSFENTFTVLCIGGTWYFHPMHFGTVLRRN